MKDLYRRVNENEEENIPFQLTPYTMWNGDKDARISTKVLAVECSKTHVSQLRQRMFSKLLNVPQEMKYSNTRYFKFIPFNATGAITTKVIRAGIYLQNKFLSQSATITIVNINNLEWTVPNTTKTFQQLALEAVTEGQEESIQIFNTLEMGMADNKIHMMTTKELKEAASLWMDTLTKTLLEANPSATFWEKEMGFDGPPERLNKPDRSNAHQAYVNFLDQSFSPVTDTTYDHGLRNAPMRPSYSHVVYGNLAMRGESNDTNTQNTVSKYATTASSLTNVNDGNDSAKIQKLV